MVRARRKGEILTPPSLRSRSVRHNDDEGKQEKVTMPRSDWLTEQFEVNRGHLQGVAYRMLGSLSEADDAVQEAWIRIHASDVSEVQNLRAWLTTVTARVCLDMLRTRRARAEEEFVPELSKLRSNTSRWADPEEEIIMADSVGLALLVILDTLAPAERLAFVLHDMFGVPFDEIAQIVDRSPVAAKKMASRARRRIRGKVADPGKSLIRNRTVVEAYLAAARTGDMNALLAVLDPDAVRRADPGTLPEGAQVVVRGARTLAKETLTNSGLARLARIAMISGAPGLIVAVRRRLVVALEFKIVKQRIVEIQVVSDPARLSRLELSTGGS
jgi:RNA polymerase sigma-70 factor (ECF subfamily)